MSNNNKPPVMWAEVFYRLADSWGPILAIIILVAALNYQEVIHFFHTEFKSDVACPTTK